MRPTFFATPSDFRKWLKVNHRKESELLVGFYKVDSGKPSMTWSRSVGEALCFGWIDGVRRSIDKESYCIRFTPRRKTSTWSAVNIRKAEELTRQGFMQPAGLDVFGHRKEENSAIYSFENETKRLDRRYENRFRANKKAWKFFMAQAPSYRKVIIHLIMTAKREATRLNRLEKAIAASENRGRAL